MELTPERLGLIGGLVTLSVMAALKRFARLRSPVLGYTQYLWLFLLAFVVGDLYSIRLGVWVLAVLCFAALREYFTLVDIRLQDRWGVAGAFLAIPFMTYYIQIDWYGMFIISIPVYAFLVIPLLITFGGREPEGTVFSIGVIDFGLFLLVYCVGHIGYLARLSIGKAVLLVLAVTVCDLVGYLIRLDGRAWPLRAATRLAVALPLSVGLTLLLSDWAGIPTRHAVALGCLIPLLVEVADRTMSYIKPDLGVAEKDLVPGEGQILNSLKGFLYSAPIVFHYVRYYLS
jgi:phosphatidate cytidylyltransferase